MEMFKIIPSNHLPNDYKNYNITEKDFLINRNDFIPWLKNIIFIRKIIFENFKKRKIF